MLTPEQAKVIADVALEQQRKDFLDKLNRRARRVVWYYQVPGLASLEPFEQAKLLTVAQWRVIKTVPYWFAVIVWLCVLASSWYWTAPRSVIAPFFVIIGILGMQWVRISFVRKQLSTLTNTPNGKCSEA